MKRINCKEEVAVVILFAILTQLLFGVTFEEGWLLFGKKQIDGVKALTVDLGTLVEAYGEASKRKMHWGGAVGWVPKISLCGRRIVKAGSFERR